VTDNHEVNREETLYVRGYLKSL